MFRNDIVEMTTKQYADYITALTGKRKSAQSVANDCRNGHLECYREGDKGEWRVIVKKAFVPIEDYNKLKVEYDKAIGTIKSIRKLAEC